MRNLLIVAALFATGCISDQAMKTGLAKNSVPEIGCPAEQIEVSNVQGPSFATSPVTTWTATCQGKKFLCKSQLINGATPIEQRTEQSCKPSPM